MSELTKVGPEFWQGHIEGWKASGLTRQAYCEREGLSYQKFTYRQSQSIRRLKKQGLHFIEVPLQARKESKVLSGLQVVLPNGVQVKLGGEITFPLLEAVLSRAGSLGC